MTMYCSVGHLDSFNICSLKVFSIDAPSRSCLKLLKCMSAHHYKTTLFQAIPPDGQQPSVKAESHS